MDFTVLFLPLRLKGLIIEDLGLVYNSSRVYWSIFCSLCVYVPELSALLYTGISWLWSKFPFYDSVVADCNWIRESVWWWACFLLGSRVFYKVEVNPGHLLPDCITLGNSSNNASQFRLKGEKSYDSSLQRGCMDKSISLSIASSA